MDQQKASAPPPYQAGQPQAGQPYPQPGQPYPQPGQPYPQAGQPYGQPYPQPGQPYPQAGQPYPQAGQPYPQPMIVQPVIASSPSTVVVTSTSRGPCGNCPNGTVVEDFTVLGIILAIFFFPWGILCCFLMREKKCSSCNRRF